MRVRDLVQAVTTGDFDRIDVYTAQLDIDAFIAEQTRGTAHDRGIDAAALVERKETDLRLQQLYARQLQRSLTSVKMPDFLRQFLADVWSQAVMPRSARDGNAERATRMRQLGRSLVMSVQPKGPADRQDFLRELPNLMRGLNEGLRPDPLAGVAAQGLLRRPAAHAESLKGPGHRWRWRPTCCSSSSMRLRRRRPPRPTCNAPGPTFRAGAGNG